MPSRTLNINHNLLGAPDIYQLISERSFLLLVAENNMAAIDRLEFLLKDISSNYRSLFVPDFDSWTRKDALAAVGAGYLTYKALTLAWRAYKSFKEYGLARMVAKPSLIRTYGGTWAGRILHHTTLLTFMCAIFMNNDV